MSVSLHGFTRTFMEFLSRRVGSSFPEQGVTSYSSYTLQRCVTLPMRDLRFCCTAGSMFPFKLPWFEAQPKIQANHCLLRDPACLLGVHHAHLLNYGNGLYRPFRCRNYRGTLRAPTHMLHNLYELPYNMHATSDNSPDPHIRLHARGKRYS